ncbi:LOW QUALITY PROTEIN: hypothetical protein PHMEG_00026024 [Phytophthora megakarya]|uniref:PiggyBac transposable element-derived protein domain-containing protein n=1 Tax=Phytophthora megakarya TaxID=4795 RepID=A0A225VD53_9STRA|nr:LOW QUALITY PROTEIN: hypothetical protein PHMEG_00026024 [Phytophthora megakarya]
MGGVDVHDQLRIIQIGYTSRKYYRTLALGLLGMALVNAFILRQYNRKANNRRPAEHFEFFEELMEQLLAVDTKEAFDEIARRLHEIVRLSLYRDRRQHFRVVKLMASTGPRAPRKPRYGKLREGKQEVPPFLQSVRSLQSQAAEFTKYYCPECSIGNKRKYLCNVEREGRASICFRIWHAEWGNGNNIFLMTRERPPISCPEKRRREAVAESDGGEGDVGDEVSDNESGNDGGTGVEVL